MLGGASEEIWEHSGMIIVEWPHLWATPVMPPGVPWMV